MTYLETLLEMIEIGVSKLLARHDYSDVAVILPAHNEEIGVGVTTEGFLKSLPGCSVFVCNNGSTDATSEVAELAGAVVINEDMVGKGNAVRRLLTSVNAKIYVMADADLTYDADMSKEMVDLLERDNLDMVTGVRIHNDSSAYRSGHILGNKVFNWLFRGLFDTKTKDVFSGYRVFSQRFARVLSIRSKGFEVEAEISALAAILGVAVGERNVPYSPRLSGSHSKLKTYSDGYKILRTYISMIKNFHPKRFYGFFAVLIGFTSICFGTPVIFTYIETGLVPRLPTAILASSLGIVSMLALLVGIVLEAIAKFRIEQRQLFLLSQKSR